MLGDFQLVVVTEALSLTEGELEGLGTLGTAARSPTPERQRGTPPERIEARPPSEARYAEGRIRDGMGFRDLERERVRLQSACGMGWMEEICRNGPRPSAEAYTHAVGSNPTARKGMAERMKAIDLGSITYIVRFRNLRGPFDFWVERSEGRKVAA